MQPVTFMLVLAALRFVIALSMYVLYRRLRTRGTALLSLSLFVYALAPVLAIVLDGASLASVLAATTQAFAAVLLLLGLLSHFERPAPRLAVQVALAGLVGAIVGAVFPVPGGIRLGFVTLIVATTFELVRSRRAFVRVAGNTYYGALALASFGLVFYVIRTFAPSLMSAHAEQISQIMLSAAIGLYLLNFEFNVSYIALDRERTRYKTLFDAAGDIILVSDFEGHLLDANQGAAERLGYTLEQLRTMDIADIDTPDDAGRVLERLEAIRTRGAAVFESENLCADGTPIPVEVNARLTEWGGRPAVLGIIRDITERRHSEETIARMAYYDPLTGLANRRLATDRLNQAIEHANRTDEQVALLFLDLDQFKTVNDTLGHTTGDELLIAVGDRLSKLVRSGDTVARLGGDEFMLLIVDVVSKDATATVAWKVLEALRQPFVIGEHEIHATASMGISVFEAGCCSAVELLRDADIAMYKAKDRGRNTFQFHDPALNAAAVERFKLKSDLRRAIDDDELTVVYQPQIDVSDLRIVGAEALLRWNHPVRGPVAPDEFVPLAEEGGLIGAIGGWVLLQACRQARVWHDEGFPDLRLGVNVSARQFTAVDFTVEVAGVLAQTGLPAACLELEITESIAMRHSEDIATVFRSLDALGVRIAIDDFGTGHSSLERLASFPIHTLKVAKPFIAAIESSEDESAIARSIILLANSLRLNVIAEGVEQQRQLDFLRENDCPQMQGFLFSRPVSADEFLTLLQEKGSSATTFAEKPSSRV